MDLNDEIQGPSTTELLSGPVQGGFVDTHGMAPFLPGGNMWELSGSGITVANLELSRLTHDEFYNTIIQTFSPPINGNDHGTGTTGLIINLGVANTAETALSREAQMISGAWSQLELVIDTFSPVGINQSFGAPDAWGTKTCSGVVYPFWKGGSATTLDGFGRYTNYTYYMDDVVANNPNVLITQSSGNYKSEGPSLVSIMNDGYRSSEDNPTACDVLRHSVRFPNLDTPTYDTLVQNATAKNVLTVGFVNGVYNPGDPIEVDFRSSAGPTNDGRIKPEVMGVQSVRRADGTIRAHTTPSHTSDSAYGVKSGSSASAPIVQSIHVAAQELASLRMGRFMRSDEAKALLIGTTIDLENPGPDYTSGFGMVDATKAMIGSYNADNLIKLVDVGNSNEVRIPLYAFDSESQDIEVTAVWIDKAVDDNLGVLQHDIDIYIDATAGPEYPWKLDPSNPSLPATKGINTLDNVEKINYFMPSIGTVDLVITGSGMQGKEQQKVALFSFNFALPVLADIKSFLLGPYDIASGDMSVVDEEEVPTEQPYSSGPWNYGGTESVAIIPSNVVDWVLVDLVTGDPLSEPMTIEARKAAFITEDGTIVAHDGGGAGFIDFGSIPQTDYYIVVHHRNHLSVMSAQSASGTTLSYDFTTSASQAYGSNAMKELEPGVWGFWGGDGNADGHITAFDFIDVWLLENGGPPGYWMGDFDLNKSVTSFDFVNVWLPSNGMSNQLPNMSFIGSLSDRKSAGEIAQFSASDSFPDETPSPIRGKLLTRAIGENEIEVAIALNSVEPTTLGSSTFWLAFDPEAVRFSSQPTEGSNGDYDYLAFSERNNDSYSSTVTAPLPGVVAINISLLEEGRGTLVSRESFVEFVNLRFDVLDPSRESGIVWLRCEVTDGDYNPLSRNCSNMVDNARNVELINLVDVPSSEKLIKGVYPNPFNPSSQLSLQLESGRLIVDVFDVWGRKVLVVHDGQVDAGEFTLAINGHDLASGTYILRVLNDNKMESIRIVLIE